MVWTRPTDISGLVWLSLELENGQFFNMPNFGLKTKDIKKITANNIEMLKQRVKDALQWLLDTGKAKSIDVVVERDSVDYNRINWKVEAVQADGLPIEASGFRTVGGPSSGFSFP